MSQSNPNPTAWTGKGWEILRVPNPTAAIGIHGHLKWNVYLDGNWVEGFRTKQAARAYVQRRKGRR